MTIFRTLFLTDFKFLYCSTIHIATIQGDLFRLRRLMVIYKYNKTDINVRSMDEKKEVIVDFASEIFLIKHSISDIFCTHSYKFQILTERNRFSDAASLCYVGRKK